ncbi:putative gustatory receptor 2a [Culicoides brevitarsis]|uniref:putative gustatory receptor 2a n=1 Tax=Culicoides brevitarsis TaxID=469753 RepID=UPI00307B44F0
MQLIEKRKLIFRVLVVTKCRSRMLSKLNITRFYQFLGLLVVAEAETEESRRWERCLKLWSCVIFALNLCVTVISFYYADEIFYSNDVVGKFNDFLKYLMVSGTFYVTIIESFGKAGNLKKFYRRFLHVRDKCRAINVDVVPVLDDFKYKLNRKVVPVVILCLCYVIYECGIFKSTKKMQFYAYISTFPAFVCRCRHLQFAYYVVHVNAVIEALNEKLRSIMRQSKDTKNLDGTVTKSDMKDEKMLCEQLERVKIVYGEVWMLTHDVNEFFGWSTCFNFAQNFVEITCDLYWIYMTMTLTRVTGYNRINFILLIIFPILTMMSICCLINATSKCYFEASKSPQILHQICRKPKNVDLNNLVRHFSLQLKHEEIKFTAHNFFTVSRSLLGDIAGGVVAYLVIFVQFAPQKFDV